MSEILVCKNVTKKYTSTVAVDGLDLVIESGKITGLLGPNGAGKTTLIKMINGLLTVTEGEIYVCGKKPGVETKALVSYLPDCEFLNRNMTVGKAIDMFCDFFTDFRRELACQMLGKLGITVNDSIKRLSKGNREKISLILAMSRNAKLYLLDEPIAAVDPATRDYIISTIINNYNPEASVIISTHLIADIEQVLDDVIFIKEGKIILHNTVDEIRGQYGMSVDELFREKFRW
ncbi:MAG: ABC transporter ATP-binding protein [Clostridia bacterium]|nr:ABC transporter ATP-binding protein [Clostridia bacterium]